MKYSLFLFFLFISIPSLYCQGNDTSFFNTDSNSKAIQGYDVVSYFTEKQPVQGNKDISFVFNQTQFYFISLENRELFQKNPSKYLPKYSGWCAYAMASNQRVRINSNSYIVNGDDLFLFYQTAFVNTGSKWIKDSINLKNKADLNWKKCIESYD